MLFRSSVTYCITEEHYELQAGDLLLIKPNVNHGPVFCTPTQTYERIVLWISCSLLKELSTPSTVLESCFYNPSASFMRLNSSHKEKLLAMLKELLDEQQLSFHPNAAFFGTQDYYKILLGHLLVSLNRIALSDSKLQETSSHNLITSVLSYLTTHLDEDLSLDVLAEHFYVSKYHLSRQFKAIIGMSLYQYVLKQRLIKAGRLVYDGISLTDACRICGFNDYSSFFRAFKKEFGVSPKLLKRRKQEHQ